MRPSTRKAIVIAVGIAALGAEFGAPGDGAERAPWSDRALASFGSIQVPSFLQLPSFWGEAEATGAEGVDLVASAEPAAGVSLEPQLIAAMRRESLARRAQRSLDPW